MAGVNQSLCFTILIVAFLLCFATCSESMSFNGQKRIVAKSWCIANPLSGPDKLQEAINFCCSKPQVGCSVIASGGSCFNPNTLADHASVVMNLYYKNTGMHKENCYINGYGMTTFQDPSSGTCKYE